MPLDANDLRRIAATGDALAEWQRAVIGSSARIHFPLRDVVQLRDYARVLRVVASKLEQLSTSKDDDWHVLYDARNALKLADRLIRTGKG